MSPLSFHNIELHHFLLLSAILFVIGIVGIVINRRNIIVILMSLELILLSVNINLVSFSAFYGNITGQVFTFFILTVAAAEMAIGLAILTIFFRNRGSVEVDAADMMRG